MLLDLLQLLVLLDKMSVLLLKREPPGFCGLSDDPLCNELWNDILGKLSPDWISTVLSHFELTHTSFTEKQSHIRRFEYDLSITRNHRRSRWGSP